GMSDAVWIMSGVTFAAAEPGTGAAGAATERRQASETSTEARAAFFMGGGPFWGRRQALLAAVRHDGNGWRGSGGERRRHAGHDVVATHITPNMTVNISRNRAIYSGMSSTSISQVPTSLPSMMSRKAAIMKTMAMTIQTRTRLTANTSSGSRFFSAPIMPSPMAPNTPRWRSATWPRLIA